MDTRRTPKPCPFCHEVNYGFTFPQHDTIAVHCLVCCAQGPEGASEEDAVLKWNRRPHEERLGNEVVYLALCTATTAGQDADRAKTPIGDLRRHTALVKHCLAMLRSEGPQPVVRVVFPQQAREELESALARLKKSLEKREAKA